MLRDAFKNLRFASKLRSDNLIKFSERAASVRSLLYIKAFSTVHAISDCNPASSKHPTMLKPKIYVTGPLQKSTISTKTTLRKLYQIHHATKDLPSTGINKEVYTSSKQCTSLQCYIYLVGARGNTQKAADGSCDERIYNVHAN